MYLQRKYGIGKIGSLDVKETKRITNRIIRKNYERKRPTSSEICKNVEVQMNNSDSDVSHISDEDFVPQPSTSSAKPQWQMRISLNTTAVTSDGYGVSDRATAAIASSVLQDVGLINESDTSYVVNKSKVRREKTCVRASLQSDISLEIYGLYFDGRKDNTLSVEKTGRKHFRRTYKEEHYSLIQELGSTYIGHTCPSSSSATDIAKSITSYL